MAEREKVINRESITSLTQSKASGKLEIYNCISQISFIRLECSAKALKT